MEGGRSASGVGIDDVFLGPRATMPGVDHDDWEVFGRLKSCPEDFEVTELSLDGTPAILDDRDTLPSEEENNDGGEKEKEETNESSPDAVDDETTTTTTNGVDTDHDGDNATPSVGDENLTVTDPTSRVERYLRSAFADDERARRAFESMEASQRSARARLVAASDADAAAASAKEDAERDDDDGDGTWIPPPAVDSRTSRSDFHAAVRERFPFLRTRVADASESTALDAAETARRTSDDADDVTTTTEGRWIRAEVDDVFFPLAPHLSHPAEDLSSLLAFRRANGAGGAEEVTLRVRPTRDDKETRRTLHHAVSAVCCDLGTSTRRIDATTAAIVVTWSRSAVCRRSIASMFRAIALAEEKKLG